MSIDTPKRFNRIVAIFIQLQSKRVVKAQDMADRFGVSLRTIYRDIRALEASGVPIYGEAGSGYSLVDGYRLPPVMFTREEAGSFVAAEKLMQHFSDETFGAYFESAMFKIKSVLKGEEKDWIATLNNQVLVSPSRRLFNKAVPNALELLFESIAVQQQVWIYYQSLEAEQPVERFIEPVGLFHENGYWYMMAWCHLRMDYRQFRMDRIHQIRRSGKPFSRQHGSIDEYLNRKCQNAGTRIRLLVEKKMVRHMKSSRDYFGFISETDQGSRVEMTFMTSDTEHSFPRWFIMFADHAEILEPLSLKERVKELLSTALSKLP